MEVEEGWDAASNNEKDNMTLDKNELSAPLFTDDDALRYFSVTDVTKLLRSAYLSNMFKRLSDYEDPDGMSKNAITVDDPEYAYLSDCSNLVLRIEAEKSRVMAFLRAHYGIRFPELAMFLTDMVLYAKVVKVIQNNMDLTAVVDVLDELIPSQMLVVIIVCASTTAGRDLTEEELKRVLVACQEMENLELAKQTFLEYIQCSMPLIAPNLCAFLGTGITSQLFAITSSLAKLSVMDASELAVLGSRRGTDSGIAMRTTGFLSNSDLVCNLPPQLRPKALRQVAVITLNLARIDANRRAGNKDAGIKERRSLCNRMKVWIDPPVIRGAGHNTYERRGRQRRRRRF
ncbi:unnamed protein product [Phytomonas sp. Hart1]|nr:unnamed protein product [Phytomonas sp. Hart1]|eukprot:CCW66125.1 unnamed protein product [Phytomonas sp. isolate Hart1]